MNRAQFDELHSRGKVFVKKTIEYNPLPSATDPTQDVPLRMVEVNSLGQTVNVKTHNAVFSNVPADQLSSIERRHTDRFDALGELQSISSDVSSRGIVKTDYKPIKNKKNNDEK